MIASSQPVTKPEISQMYADTESGGLSQQDTLMPNSASSVTASSKIKYATSPRRSPSTPKLNKNGSMTPSAALAQYEKVLSPYEQEEIKQYTEVWFVGPTARKLNAGEGKGKNFGYDDDKGRYKCVKNDHVSYRFEVLKGLGKGSFGDVVKAYDHKNQCTVALKIIRNEKRFHKQGKCEVKILDHLRRHDPDGTFNVIHMKDYFLFRGHLCITFDMMHSDMYSALKRDQFKGFSVPRVRGFAEQMLQSMRLLKQLHIIHCDLKPENILLETAGSDKIKVIDFGSSCFDDQRVHTYIQSRFYRSPEVILGLSYGCPIDMWSLGCILIEMHTGQPVFPGHNEKEQLMYQMQVLGVPPSDLLRRGKRTDTFFDSDDAPKHLVDRKGRTRPPGSRPLATAVGSNDPAFIDFVSKCLVWDPELRMTPEQALVHPFVSGATESSAAAESTSTRADSALTTANPSDGENLPPAVAPSGKGAAESKEAPKKARSAMGLLRSLKSRKSTSGSTA